MNQLSSKGFDNVVPLRTKLLPGDEDPGPGARGLKWGLACAIGAWVFFVAVIVLAGCVEKPAVDPYAPWYNIPKPIDCSRPGVPKCEQWIEPGMMVRP